MNEWGVGGCRVYRLGLFVWLVEDPGVEKSFVLAIRGVQGFYADSVFSIFLQPPTRFSLRLCM